MAVGNFWRACSSKDVYATVWNLKNGTARSLPKAREEKLCTFPDNDETWECEGDSRANAVSGDGRLIGGYESFPETGARVGVLWRGKEMELLRDPYGDNLYGGWAGEVMAVNAAGTIAVGGNIGPELMEAYKWTPTEGVTALGRLPGLICYVDWMTGERICEQGERETLATSVSDDGKVILGSSFGEAAIYTPRMGWMLLGEFLGRQGVLEASRWTVLGAAVSGDGKTFAGTGIPLAGAATRASVSTSTRRTSATARARNASRSLMVSNSTSDTATRSGSAPDSCRTE